MTESIPGATPAPSRPASSPTSPAPPQSQSGVPTLTLWRRGDALEPLFDREWLITNGLGGYASGTLAGACTRRFHGLLVAAHTAPLGRILFLGHLEEQVESQGQLVTLSGSEGEAPMTAGLRYLERISLVDGLPVWHYRVGSLLLEKRIYMAHLNNTTYVRYGVSGDAQGGQLLLRPFLNFRPHEGRVDETPHRQSMTQHGQLLEFTQEAYPGLKLQVTGAPWTFEPDACRRQLDYRVELARGYDGRGDIASPGFIRVPLASGSAATLIVSTEPPHHFNGVAADEVLKAEHARRSRCVAMAHPALREGPAALLVLAADQFVALPKTRSNDAMLARSAGVEARTIMAGYPWFTDWGRDTMISLEGLCLRTGRVAEAGSILRMFAHHVRDGLIPNLFPEGEQQGLYHTADATLWFFHALERYVTLSGDEETLHQLLPVLEGIIDHHLQGTRFGIRVDPADGLLTQGEPRYQLTWMDAKVGDWVVTPRRGKAVELNALFHNALLLLANWKAQAGQGAAAAPLRAHAARLQASFNRRFWNEASQCLYDVVDGEDGDDASLRPNQLLAISLRHAVLDPARWHAVMEAVGRELLTPVGLRTLSPGHPAYKANYRGDLRARDAAYHQGTVWPWLMGPYVDAWLRVHPDQVPAARQLLEGFYPRLTEYCMGTLAEIHDAEPPYHPRGCVAQAWSVAEVLRSLARVDEAGRAGATPRG